MNSSSQSLGQTLREPSAHPPKVRPSSPPTDVRLAPEQIRQLRGSRTRAAFAAMLGVTPQSIYRWELPAASPQSRRPRHPDAARIYALYIGNQGVSSAGQAARVPSSAPAMSSSHPLARVVSRATLLMEGVRSVQPNTAASLPIALGAQANASEGAAAAFERLLRGDIAYAETQFLGLLSRDKSAAAGDVALASIGLALVEAIVRGNARRALLALTPALRVESEHGLPERMRLFLHATSAALHSLPDGQLFDVGRVHAKARLVAESPLIQSEPDTQCIIALATMRAALFAGDQESVTRAMRLTETLEDDGISPLFELHREELRGFCALLGGQVSSAKARFADLGERAVREGDAPVAARAFAYLALRKLDDLESPDEVLALVERANTIATRARLAPGVHSVFAARSAAEAWIRKGDLVAAEAALELADDYERETGMPATVAMAAHSRLLYLRGDHAGLVALRERFLATANPSARPLARACALLIDAVRLLWCTEETEATLLAFERAESAAKGWPFLVRDAQLFGTGALVVAGRFEEAKLALRRTSASLDRAPSPWAAAHVMRLEGMLAGFTGDWTNGRALLEAAIATFEQASDLPDALLTRKTQLSLAHGMQEPGAAKRALAVDAELAGIGVRPPAAVRVGEALFASLRKERRVRVAPDRPIAVAELVVPLRRLAVRGSVPDLVLRELVAVLQSLMPGRTFALERFGLDGETTLVNCINQPSSRLLEAAAVEVLEWCEFGDGLETRFRIGASGDLSSAEQAALSVIVVTASLALEVAGLRGKGSTRIATLPEELVRELPGVVAVSKAMRRVSREIVRLRESRATVVIAGESGTGKEVVARAIHEISARKGRPYVALNCASVPRELFEGQLFGHKRGAFTGAASDQPGVLRAADGGTVFLDEVGELPLDLQPKLLRFLENGEIFPLGEKRPIQVDVRVITATHRDLASLVRLGAFREDLYYRLQVVPLHIPPLRERRDDIVPLAKHFLAQLTRGDGGPESTRGKAQTSLKPPALAEDAIEMLVSYNYPGNVRELRNILERTLAFATDLDVIRAADLRMG